MRQVVEQPVIKKPGASAPRLMPTRDISKLRLIYYGVLVV
jgi:hypothetical protein